MNAAIPLLFRCTVLGLACSAGWNALDVEAAAADEAPAQEEPGDNSSALPGFVRMGAVTTGGRRMGFAATGGYGWTEAQDISGGPKDASHSKVFGSAAVSGRPLRWLSFYLRADGRYDIHPKDDQGSDDSLSGMPTLGTRLAFKVAKDWHLGADISAFVPGAGAPSLDFSATSLDSVLLTNYQPSAVKGLTLGAQAGFRFDQSAKSVNDKANLRTGDFIALGVNDYNAVMLGLAASYRVRKIEWLGEYTWNLLIGGGAPSAGNSPMHLAGGARYFLTEDAQLEFLVDALLSGRQAVVVGGPLFPIDSRISASVGFRYRLPFDKRAAPAAKKAAVAPVVVLPPKPVVGVVIGTISDDRGMPLGNATVEARAGDKPIGTQTTDTFGNYRFDNVPVGHVEIAVAAVRFKKATSALAVTAGVTGRGDFTLEPEQPPAQLRGLVRSFSGRGISASLSIEPSGSQARTESDGRFSIDIAPGAYQVTIEAPGYQPQTRAVVVEEYGVTVLNVELRQGRGARGN